MITEQMAEITFDPGATGTCGIVITTVASKRKLAQTYRKAIEITIKSKLFTTVTVPSTLRIPEPETIIVTNDHNDDNM
ncbi:hypothetical protein DPMN_141992 [Dreissena polymorpha]|uniref:Uncharacterized protein n=1 Tax=Dreissena polymorpha TaxID=45954 RepID=A0A9D4JI81_DREPO|nr:hypothetical protein DPMN_141992 [Dreissena polymorpha]